MKKIKSQRDRILFIVIVILLIFLKCYFVCDFPIIAHIALGEDDALMVNLASNIVDGKWLGDYNYNTLLKGPVFPKILAMCFQFGIPYITAMTLLYSFSCVVFILAVKDRVKNKYALLALFILLLFNPIMFTQDVIQRVYRNALIPSFALLIVGSYIAIYLKKDKKVWKLLPWAMIGGISLALFYYTREDSIWIVPFLIFMTTAILICLFMQLKKQKGQAVAKIFITILPIIILMITGNYIATKNETYYGLKTTNVLNDSHFADAISAIFAVKPNEKIEYVTVTREKVARIAENSIMFATITPKLNVMMDGYDACDVHPFNNELADGWFFWALRNAVRESGYETLAEEEVVYAQMAEEINQALEDGRLEKQAIMPSSLISPWQKGNMAKLLKAMGQSVVFIATYDDMKISNTCISECNAETYQDVKHFEKLSHNRAIYPENMTDLNGKLIPKLENQQEYINSLQGRKQFLNVLIKIYAVIGVLLGIFGAIFYIKFTINTFQDIFHKTYEKLDIWIVLSGILGALITLVAGISYNHITACHSINTLYLAGAYPLYLAFVGLMLYVAVASHFQNKSGIV